MWSGRGSGKVEGELRVEIRFKAGANFLPSRKRQNVYNWKESSTQPNMTSSFLNAQNILNSRVVSTVDSLVMGRPSMRCVS